MLERFDAQATARGLSRAGALRLLVNEGLPEREAGSLSEALALLAASARAGSVQAQVALVRALAEREKRADPVKRRRDELAARRAQRGQA